MSTKIEWTEETWNPITGCTKVSTGCKNCYAERMAKRLAGRYGYPADEPFEVTLQPERLWIPSRWKKPRRVFVCSMGDLFHSLVPRQYIKDIFWAMRNADQHTYQVLTKRPYNAKWFYEDTEDLPFWPLSHVWIGATIEDQENTDRIEPLQDTPAGKHFLSCEPLLGPIEFSAQDIYGPLDWVIVGAETGPGARYMDPDWARDIRDQCKAAGVPFFMKQMSNREPIPDDLMIREYPA